MKNLNEQELIEIQGGDLKRLLRPSSYLARKLKRAAEEFIEGWNSVECNCNKE